MNALFPTVVRHTLGVILGLLCLLAYWLLIVLTLCLWSSLAPDSMQEAIDLARHPAAFLLGLTLTVVGSGLLSYPTWSGSGLLLMTFGGGLIWLCNQSLIPTGPL